MNSENFWNFSTRFYATPGVAEACLKLQDIYDLDVNILLYCIWHGVNHGVIATPLLQQVSEFSDDWAAQVVKPLRHSRTWLKQQEDLLQKENGQFQQFRNTVKKLELQAEHLQQNYLESLVTDPAVTASIPVAGMGQSCSDNLLNYLEKAGIEPAAELISLFEEMAAVAITQPDQAD